MCTGTQNEKVEPFAIERGIGIYALTQLNQIALNCRFYFDTYHQFISLRGNSLCIHDTELKRVPRTASAPVSKSICDQKTLSHCDKKSFLVPKKIFKMKNWKHFSCLFTVYNISFLFSCLITKISYLFTFSRYQLFVYFS